MSPCINKICWVEKAKIQSKVSSLILFVKGNTMRALRLGTTPKHVWPPKNDLFDYRPQAPAHFLGPSVGGRGVCTMWTWPIANAIILHCNSITTMAAAYEQNYSTAAVGKVFSEWFSTVLQLHLNCALRWHKAICVCHVTAWWHM